MYGSHISSRKDKLAGGSWGHVLLQECGPQHWVCLRLGLFREEDASLGLALPLLFGFCVCENPGALQLLIFPISQEDIILILRLCQLFVLNPALYRQFFDEPEITFMAWKIPFSWEVLLCFEYILTPWGNIHRDMGIKSNSRDIPSITVTPGRLHPHHPRRR